ncbi:MAG: LysM peptidoglycan-binding domain-containing protein [Spirochaetes bacterium]|nr:LysM peptidoglycan-binding domain-containing protein [Spirochaetota bacterium]
MPARKSLTLTFLMLLSFAFISCDMDVPVKEMVEARTLISKARLVLAEKYDPDNLTKAVEHLFDSHTMLVEKKSKQAKESAVKAANFAEMAIDASLPKAAEETLAEAKSTYEEAERLNAEAFAPEQFRRAGEAIKESEELAGAADLMGAFLKAREAVGVGAEAKEIAMSNIPKLNDTIAGMKKEIDEFSALKLTDKQKQSLADARSELDRAGALITEGNLKDAVALIQESEEALNEVKGVARILSAQERISNLRKEVEQLKKERGSEFAGEDLDLVSASLNEAEALLQQDKTEEALRKITDAETSLAVAKDKTVKGVATGRAESVERLLAEARKKDGEGKFKAELDRASVMVDDGKKLLASESYGESIAKFEEAELLINSLGIVRERDRLKGDGAISDLEGKRVYRVIYNRKKRDCLWRIAQKVYKNARLWPLIYMANRNQIKDPDLIFPGQRFVIPDVPERKGPRPDEKGGDPAIKEDDDATGGEGTTE